MNGKPTYMLAWTTTPWTLPSNLALGVSPQSAMSLSMPARSVYVLGKNALARYQRLLGAAPVIVEECAGSELAGLGYEPMYPYFARSRNDGKAFRILAVDFVDGR